MEKGKDVDCDFRGIEIFGIVLSNLQLRISFCFRPIIIEKFDNDEDLNVWYYNNDFPILNI